MQKKHHALEVNITTPEKASRTAESTPLLRNNSGKGTAPSRNVPDFVTHPRDLYDYVVKDPKDARTLGRNVLSASRTNMGPGSDQLPTFKPKLGTWDSTLSKIDILATAEQPWGTKAMHTKVANILQMPVRFLLIISTPVVYYGDRDKAWDRYRRP